MSLTIRVYFQVTKIDIILQISKLSRIFLPFLLFFPAIFLNFAPQFFVNTHLKTNFFLLMTTKNSIALVALFATALFSSCQKSLEEKAMQDAKEYTRKYCPTPIINNTRTDSVTFNMETHVYTYHCTFSGVLDNEDIIQQNKQKITEVLASSVRESTSMKPYVQAGFHFQYICRSAKNPEIILLQAKF